jgi:poly(3-hydroxybutyrate) depolymerase
MRKSAVFGLAVLALCLVRCGGDDTGGGTVDPAQLANADGGGDLDGATGTDGADAALADDSATSNLPTTSPGCGTAATPSGSSGDLKTITVGGVSREFVLYVPAGYDKTRSYPIVTVWHGIDATGPEMAAWITMQDYSAPNAIVAFPSALNKTWDVGGDKDLAFFDAMVGSLESTLCVNEQRVFALGFSYGAYMVNHLGCKRSSTVRAIVAADGGFPGPTGCGKTAALVYHRREDKNEVIANGMKARDLWLGINGCANTSTPVTAYGLAGLGCVQYDGCPSATPVVWCEDTATTQWKHDLRDVYRVPMWNWFNHF